MPLSHRERFALKRQMIDVLEDSPDWDWRRTNLLLAEYDCQTLGGYNDDSSFEENIKGLDDAELVDMYSLVTGWIRLKLGCGLRS